MDDLAWETHPEAGVLRYPHMPRGWEIFVKYEAADGGWRCWAHRPAEKWTARRTFVEGGADELHRAQEAALALIS
jgi:hypothetical protein